MESSDEGLLVIDEDGKKKDSVYATTTPTRAQLHHAKGWIEDTINIASNSILPLESIYDAYMVHCEETGHEMPISSASLGRLVYKSFELSVADKCRLGPRRKQKVNYRNLSFKTSEGTPKNGVVSVKERKSVPSMRRLLVPKIDKTLLYSQSDMTEDECAEAAKKLFIYLKDLHTKKQMEPVLADFAHSAFCKTEFYCSRLCMTFKGLRRHMLASRHNCRSTRLLYNNITLLHIPNCQNSNCGLSVCLDKRVTRGTQEDEEDNHNATEWLLDSIIITTSNAYLSLESIYDAYKIHCEDIGKCIPITSIELACFIRIVFQSVVMTRLGPNQKIWFINLSFRTSEGIVLPDEPIDLSTKRVNVPTVSSDGKNWTREEEECAEGKKNLSFYIRLGINKKWAFHILSHSTACKDEICAIECMAIKRIRIHLSSSVQHDCSVMKLYSGLFMLHVLSCRKKKSSCWIPVCRARQAARECDIKEEEINQARSYLISLLQ